MTKLVVKQTEKLVNTSLTDYTSSQTDYTSSQNDLLHCHLEDSHIDHSNLSI